MSASDSVAAAAHRAAMHRDARNVMHRLLAPACSMFIAAALCDGSASAQPYIKTFAKVRAESIGGYSLIPDDIDRPPDLEWTWNGPSPLEMFSTTRSISDGGNGWNLLPPLPTQQAWGWSIGQQAGDQADRGNFPSNGGIREGGVSLAIAGARVTRRTPDEGPALVAGGCYQNTLVVVPPARAGTGPVNLNVTLLQSIGLDQSQSYLAEGAHGGFMGGGIFEFSAAGAENGGFQYSWLAEGIISTDELGHSTYEFAETELVPGSLPYSVGPEYLDSVQRALVGGAGWGSMGTLWHSTIPVVIKPKPAGPDSIDPSSLVFYAKVHTSAGAWMNRFGSDPGNDTIGVDGSVLGAAQSQMLLDVQAPPQSHHWTIALVAKPITVAHFQVKHDATLGVGSELTLVGFDPHWSSFPNGYRTTQPYFSEHGYSLRPVSRCRYFLDKNNSGFIDAGDEQIADATDGDAWNGGDRGMWEARVVVRSEWGPSFRILAVFENALGERGFSVGRTLALGSSGGGGTSGQQTLEEAFGNVTNRSVRMTSSASGDLTAVTRSDAGAPLILQRSASATEWTSYDMRSGFAVSGDASDLNAWVDPVTQETWVMAIMDSATSMVNLNTGEVIVQSSIVAGAESIVAAPTVVFGLTGDVFVSGLSAGGELLLFSGSHTPSGVVWSYTNLSRDHLGVQGLVSPLFRGKLMSYANSWGGLNFAGLDQSGQVQVVWWAPGMPLWTLSNLSEISKSPAIHGELSVYTTAWGAVNLTGTDAEGKVVVVWWVPEFKGDWVLSRLSEMFDGPAIRPESISSYVTPWGGTNIVGTDSNGKVIAYWWAPGLERWEISPMTDLISGAVLPGTATVEGFTSPLGEMNLISSNHDGDVFRYYFVPGSSWKSENLSTTAKVIDP